MQAQTLPPSDLFGNQVRYVVPLFQRPYIWTKDAQWEPLWNDVREVADRILATKAAKTDDDPIASHFLGAIVVEQAPSLVNFISAWRIIDGQQRLTTLQLLLDAARIVTSKYGRPIDANVLGLLVSNERGVMKNDDERYKVWPTDRDQAAFRAAMSAAEGDQQNAPIVAAHRYFQVAITRWGKVDSAEETQNRLAALTQALHKHLMFVVISLAPTDNAQVIFETLNHRGAPLLAADLIKNLIFQIAQNQKKDVDHLYRSYWMELDTDYWRQRIARGRQYVPRIDIFMNHWLIARLGREVQTDRIFTTFRDHVIKTEIDTERLLQQLSSTSKVYASFDRLQPSSVEGQFRYRVIQVLDAGVVTPVLLRLLSYPADQLPPRERERALRAIESVMVRRALCRLTTKDNNNLVLDILKAIADNGPQNAGRAVEELLLKQTADSRFWPPDAMVEEALRDTALYSPRTQPRVRMVLEAIEDQLRTGKGEGTRCPRDLTIEHVMPQAWREHWSSSLSRDPGAADRRDKAIQTLGNLTLVTNRLNPAMSNKPWTEADTQGKRDELLRHSVLKLNAVLVAENHDAWTDEAIAKRTAALSRLVLTEWPRPGATATPRVTLKDAEKDTTPTHVDDETAYSGKYKPLAEWLEAQTVDVLPITFDELEDILGFPLPMTARTQSSYWSNRSSAISKALTAAGFKAVGISMTQETLTFKRARLS